MNKTSLVVKSGIGYFPNKTQKITQKRAGSREGLLRSSRIRDILIESSGMRVDPSIASPPFGGRRGTDLHVGPAVVAHDVEAEEVVPLRLIARHGRLRGDHRRRTPTPGAPGATPRLCHGKGGIGRSHSVGWAPLCESRTLPWRMMMAIAQHAPPYPAGPRAGVWSGGGSQGAGGGSPPLHGGLRKERGVPGACTPGRVDELE